MPVTRPPRQQAGATLIEALVAVLIFSIGILAVIAMIAGYGLLADWLIRLDPLNPQTAARMSTAFETWPRYDADRQALESARFALGPQLSLSTPAPRYNLN